MKTDTVQIAVEASDWAALPYFTEVIGGLKIDVGGETLVGFPGPSPGREYDHAPEYFGVYLDTDLEALYFELRDIYDGEYGVYDPATVGVTEIDYHYVLEPLSGDALRIAFRSSDPGAASDAHLPLPRSACGYVVDRDDFARELADAHRVLTDRAEREGVSPDDARRREFERRAAELEEYAG